MILDCWGQGFDKQFIDLTEEDVANVAENYHNLQQTDYKETYKIIPVYCSSSSFEEIQVYIQNNLDHLIRCC
jgi:type I restriction enzyme M protein